MKTVVTDLDGTLLENGTLNDEVISICKEFQKNHRLVLATGRNRHSANHIIDALGLKNGGAILMNGMLFHDFKDDEIIKKEPFETTEVQRIIKIAHLCFFRVSLVTENERVALNSLYDRLFYLARLIVKQKPMPKFLKSDIPEGVCKIELGPTIFFSFFYQLFYYLMNNKYEIVKTSKYWVEIIPNQVSKVDMVKYLINKYNIDLEDLYIFGDGENDISMLKLTDNSYASRNALDNVKAVCKNVCSDSVAKEIEKLI